MKVLNSVLDLIGNTPMVKLRKLTEKIEADVLVKLEYLNPSGSLKDRIALEMINKAEKKGVLKRGYTIIESSTGNTGIALSFVGSQMGYRVLIYETMPGSMSRERIKIMSSYGAEVILTSPEKGDIGEMSISGADVELPGRKICMEMERKNADMWWARQFSNPSNVSAHNETGREILEQTDRKIDVFVASIGTGGTLMGISEVLKKMNVNTRIIGIQPAGDPLPIVPGKPYPRTEISGGIISDMMEKRLVDEVVRVDDEEAVNTAHRLWEEEGLFCGISSGANAFIALKEAKKLRRGDVVVTVLPDSADRYLSEEHFVT